MNSSVNISRQIILTLIIIFCCFSSKGQTLSDIKRALSNTNSKIIATFLYAYPKHFEWPEGSDTGPFVIAVLDDGSTVGAELRKHRKKWKARTRKNRKLKVKIYKDVEKIKPRCHILYLGNKTSYCDEAIKEILDATEGILLVTYKTDCEETMINIYVVNNKLSFSINPKYLEKQKIKKLIKVE